MKVSCNGWFSIHCGNSLLIPQDSTLAEVAFPIKDKNWQSQHKGLAKTTTRHKWIQSLSVRGRKYEGKETLTGQK